MDFLETILKASGKSSTLERKRIFETIQKHHLITANELIGLHPEIGRASIFRTLTLFAQIGLIRRIHLGKKEDAYELTEDHHDHHHEHFRCEQCNSVISFESENICNTLEKIAKEYQFSLREHSITLLGICENCQSHNT